MPELKNIKGKDLPFFMLKALNATPFHTLKCQNHSYLFHLSSPLPSAKGHTFMQIPHIGAPISGN